MAAWGATGVVGAGLARVTRRGAHAAAPGRRAAQAPLAPGTSEPRVGRWPLAIVCCVAGFAFTVVQDVGDWVTYSDHSVA